MGSLRTLLGAGAPTCPVCTDGDGPCTHGFAGPAGPSSYRFPDRLRHTDGDGNVTDPADQVREEPAAKPRRRRGKKGPVEDRSHKPSEDRRTGEEGPSC